MLAQGSKKNRDNLHTKEKKTDKTELSKQLTESQQVLAKDRCLLNTGLFTIFVFFSEPENDFKIQMLAL